MTTTGERHAGEARDVGRRQQHLGLDDARELADLGLDADQRSALEELVGAEHDEQPHDVATPAMQLHHHLEVGVLLAPRGAQKLRDRCDPLDELVLAAGAGRRHKGFGRIGDI